MSLVRFRPEAPTKQSPGRAPSFQATCECSSSGRAPPCQGGGSEFEPRHSLHFLEQLCSIRCHSQVVRQSSAKAPLPSSNLGGTSKKRSTCFAGASFFGYLGNLKCSGQVNCPCAKVLPAAKRMYGAMVFPWGEKACRAHAGRRPEGRVGAVLSACREFENIQIVVTSHKVATI